jgi:hypothetical protein
MKIKGICFATFTINVLDLVCTKKIHEEGKYLRVLAHILVVFGSR